MHFIERLLDSKIILSRGMLFRHSIYYLFFAE